MKRLFFFLLMAITLCFSFACQKKSGEQSLRVGMDLSYPPFETINEQGDPDGVSVALAKALATYLHRPLQIDNIPFSGLIPSLQSDKIDLIISSMTKTPERSESIAFSDPYLRVGLGVLIAQPSKIHSLQELYQPGITVAVRQGTTGQLWAQKNLKQAKVVVFDKEATAVVEVLQKKADAFLYDEMSVWKYHHQYPNETAILLAPLQAESWAMGLRLSDHQLCEEVNSFLKQFHEDKGFEKLGDLYLYEQKEAFKQQCLPFYF